ncbi:MAG: hypothetical protein KGI37_11060, partial [Alphaproteobacteria bacterium]|nr:hypothetical protein [Alphaproteobacteria bacterium]
GTIAGVAAAANQPTNAAQASTTSGQTGNLVQCAATTSAPTYTTGTTNPLNCDTAGNQRVLVTNTNANGPAAASASSPVTPSNLPPGAAAINTNQVSVAATAGGTLIVAARTGVAGTGRVSATVCNTGTTAVYIGNTGLTTSTGQYLAGVAGACLTLNTTAAIYGIVATGTETVAYSETY